MSYVFMFDCFVVFIFCCMNPLRLSIVIFEKSLKEQKWCRAEHRSWSELIVWTFSLISYLGVASLSLNNFFIISKSVDPSCNSSQSWGSIFPISALMFISSSSNCPWLEWWLTWFSAFLYVEWSTKSGPYDAWNQSLCHMTYLYVNLCLKGISL